MELRTFYWNSLKVSQMRYFKSKILGDKKIAFRFGNAGDIFNADLVKFLYNVAPLNVKQGGNRLMLVGSTMSMVERGDIINGIGWKGNDLTNKRELISTLKVYGVRGPLTRRMLERNGADLAELKFEFDPGLLVKEVYGLSLDMSTEKNAIFIPHYRDIPIYNGKYPKGIKVINIDNPPEKVAREILKAKVVYASSLHGIIFSHALNKECIFVSPLTPEPLLKYEDYYFSVGLNMPTPLGDINRLNFLLDKGSIPSRQVTISDFFFPSNYFLQDVNVMV